MILRNNVSKKLYKWFGVAALLVALISFVVMRDQEHQIDEHASVGQTQTGTAQESHIIETAEFNASSATDMEESLQDMPIDAVGEKEYEKQGEILRMQARHSPHPWHAERVENIANEELAQILENLANFDDMQFASTSSSRPYAPGDPVSESYLLPRLFRVRRLLELAESEPEAVASAMRSSLLSSLDNWPEAFREEIALWDNAEHLHLSKKEPTEHDKVRMRATVATYILAETRSYESLPLLLASYRSQDQWVAQIPMEDYRLMSQCPVPPPITLYAIHRLVSTFPDDGGVRCSGPRSKAKLSCLVRSARAKGTPIPWCEIKCEV